MSGIFGNNIIKKYKEKKLNDIAEIFDSLEEHTRKIVQTYSVARKFTLQFAKEAPKDFGDFFSYTKLGNKF